MTDEGRARWTSAFARRLDEGFHVIEVSLEGATTGRRDGVLGLRHATFERLRAGDVFGFFELSGVDAEIAVRRRHELFQIVERQRLVDGERAENPEAEALVDETIERQRPLGGRF